MPLIRHAETQETHGELSPNNTSHKMRLHCTITRVLFEPDFGAALRDNDGGKERTWKIQFTDLMRQK